MSKVAVIAPHPDDETLGCGGTILKHSAASDEVHWVILTSMQEEQGYSSEQIARRGKEIERVRDSYGFAEVHQLGFVPAQLECVPRSELIGAISSIFGRVQPTDVYLPHPGDAHSDHLESFLAATACTKWFRHPSVQRILSYETLSETDISLVGPTFSPTVFVNISDYLERKIEIMGIYVSETGKFPFPRSPEAIEALARTRGASSGFEAAEAFELLHERRA